MAQTGFFKCMVHFFQPLVTFVSTEKFYSNCDQKGIFVLIVDNIQRLYKSGWRYFRAFFNQSGLKQDVPPASPAEKSDWPAHRRGRCWSQRRCKPESWVFVDLWVFRFEFDKHCLPWLHRGLPAGCNRENCNQTLSQKLFFSVSLKIDYTYRWQREVHCSSDDAVAVEAIDAGSFNLFLNRTLLFVLIF